MKNGWLCTTVRTGYHPLPIVAIDSLDELQVDFDVTRDPGSLPGDIFWKPYSWVKLSFAIVLNHNIQTIVMIGDMNSGFSSIGMFDNVSDQFLYNSKDR